MCSAAEVLALLEMEHEGLQESVMCLQSTIDEIKNEVIRRYDQVAAPKEWWHACFSERDAYYLRLHHVDIRGACMTKKHKTISAWGITDPSDYVQRARQARESITRAVADMFATRDRHANGGVDLLSPKHYWLAAEVELRFIAPA